MQQVKLPSGEIVNFPDEMTDADIAAAIQSIEGPQRPDPPVAPPTASVTDRGLMGEAPVDLLAGPQPHGGSPQSTFAGLQAQSRQGILDDLDARSTIPPLDMRRAHANTADSNVSRQAPDMSFLGRAKDNFIGIDDGVETYGEQAGNLIRGGGAAMARGMADVPALPANISQLGARGVEKLTGMEEPSMVSRALNKLPDTRDMLAAVPIIGEESKYKAPGVAGEFISTMGEFAGGAGLMAGPKSMVRYGLTPGIASETAGQVTKGTPAEPYARGAAAIVAALMGSPKPGKFASGDESSRLANKLQGGVRSVTAGQARGSQPLMRAEGRLQATPQQIDDFTAATMAKIGGAEKLATPENLLAVQKTIVSQMDDAVRGVSILPTSKEALGALDVAKRYAERVPSGSLNPRMKGIANEIRSLAVSRKSVPLSQLKEWRSDIGKFVVSKDVATGDAARSLRGLIDDMTDTALTTAGRSADITKLSQARESYRNFIGVRDAASRAGAEGGTLSPQALNQSFIRSQGRNSYATGQGTPMSDFVRAGASVLRSAPAVSAGGVRSISEALPVASAAILGGGALQSGMSPITAGLMAAGGVMAPNVGKAAMRSNLIQTLLRDPKLAMSQPLPILPGVIGGGR